MRNKNDNIKDQLLTNWGHPLVLWWYQV